MRETSFLEFLFHPAKWRRSREEMMMDCNGFWGAVEGFLKRFSERRKKNRYEKSRDPIIVNSKWRPFWRRKYWGSEECSFEFRWVEAGAEGELFAPPPPFQVVYLRICARSRKSFDAIRELGRRRGERFLCGCIFFLRRIRVKGRENWIFVEIRKGE